MAGRNVGRKRGGQQETFFDYTLLFIVLFLLGFGLVMLYSTSSYEASMEMGDSAYYLKKQVASTVLGLIVMMVIANIPYHFWERFAFLGYVVSVVLILLVLTPLGIEANGARRWINVFGISLQPAEVAKLAMILFLASLVCKMGRSIRTPKGFMIMLAAPLPICAEVYLVTKNLSSAIIIFGIAVLMVFVSSPDYKKFILIGLAGIAVCALAVYLIVNAADSDSLSFRGGRILAWLDPEAYADGKGFQTLQALYAIGSGGIWGKGLGQSMQKLGFLPEAQNDMIFSIICEELGLFGYGGNASFPFADMAVHGHCQQCFRSVWCNAGSGSDGAYCHSGHFEHCGCHQYHTKYRYFPSFHQLRRIFRIVFAGGNGSCLKRWKRN